MQPLQHDPDHSATPLALVRPPAREVEVVSFDGTRLHAEISGPEDAPTVVLAHGITCAIRAWHYQIKELGRTHRVVAFDQRGHGRSGRPAAGGYTVAALGHDLQAVFEACAPDRRVVVAGHSMGGMSVMSWAVQHADEVSDRIAGAALICTAANDVLSDAAAGLAPMASTIARRIAFAPVRTPIVPGVRTTLRWLTFGADAQPRDLAVLAGMINACPGRTRARFARSLATMDLRGELVALTAPTVVIGGRQDHLLPIAHSKQIADALPNLLDYQPLPGVGHMAPFEAHEYVSWRIADLAARYLRTT